MNNITNKSIDYDDEPVYYCKYCLSLDNPELVGDIEYCKYCGSTEFEKDSIENWENKFEEKYKQGKFLKINKKWKTIMQSLNSTML